MQQSNAQEPTVGHLWRDDEIQTLLKHFSVFVSDYIYDSDVVCAERIQPLLPGKTTEDVLSKVRSLMRSFSIAMHTKNFRTEAIETESKSVVYVNEILYNMTVRLPENQKGTIWLPAQLALLLQRIKQYHKEYFTKPDAFFSHIQIWGRSLLEVKTKFYYLCQLYHDAPDTHGQGTSSRLQVLQQLFQHVPPVSEDEYAAAPTTPKSTTCTNSKLWQPEEVDELMEFLGKITKRAMESKDIGDLVGNIKTRLNRSIGSLFFKMIDLHQKYHSGTGDQPAAGLPTVVNRRNSLMHKVFEADWSTEDNPYAAGFWMFKRLYYRAAKKPHDKSKSKGYQVKTRRHGTSASAKSSKRPKVSRSSSPQLSSASSSSTVSVVTPRVSQGTQEKPKQHLSGQEHKQLLFAADALESSEFVHKMALRLDCSVDSVQRFCQAIIDHLQLYRQSKFKEFYAVIHLVMPELKYHVAYTRTRLILMEFETCHGSLDRFGEIALFKKPPQQQPEDEAVVNRPIDVKSTESDKHLESSGRDKYRHLSIETQSEISNQAMSTGNAVARTSGHGIADNGMIQDQACQQEDQNDLHDPSPYEVGGEERVDGTSITDPVSRQRKKLAASPLRTKEQGEREGAEERDTPSEQNSPVGTEKASPAKETTAYDTESFAGDDEAEEDQEDEDQEEMQEPSNGTDHPRAPSSTGKNDGTMPIGPIQPNTSMMATCQNCLRLHMEMKRLQQGKDMSSSPSTQYDEQEEDKAEEQETPSGALAAQKACGVMVTRLSKLVDDRDREEDEAETQEVMDVDTVETWTRLMMPIRQRISQLQKKRNDLIARQDLRGRRCTHLRHQEPHSDPCQISQPKSFVQDLVLEGFSQC